MDLTKILSEFSYDDVKDPERRGLCKAFCNTMIRLMASHPMSIESQAKELLKLRTEALKFSGNF